jgi:hypothetical protein
MESMIAKFKHKFPEWNSIDWSKIYIEIEEAEVYISRLIDGNIDEGKYVSLDRVDFSRELRLIIAEFQQGSSLPNCTV